LDAEESALSARGPAPGAGIAGQRPQPAAGARRPRPAPRQRRGPDACRTVHGQGLASAPRKAATPNAAGAEIIAAPGRRQARGWARPGHSPRVLSRIAGC